MGNKDTREGRLSTLRAETCRHSTPEEQSQFLFSTHDHRHLQDVLTVLRQKGASFFSSLLFLFLSIGPICRQITTAARYTRHSALSDVGLKTATTVK